MKALRIRRAVAQEAEAVYREALELGQSVSRVFQQQAQEGAGRSQLRRLESVACSADTVGAVLDYIKGQAARLAPWRQSGLAERLVEWIERKMPGHLAAVRKRLGEGGGERPGPEGAQLLSEDEVLRIRLMLIREFVRAMVSEVEYLKVAGKGGRP